MAVNVFFNNYESFAEQTLGEDLIIESIKMFGLETFYMPRTVGAYDKLLNEDTGSQYNSAYMLEMTIKSNDFGGFGGMGDFMSTRGDTIMDTVTLIVAKRRFAEEVGDIIQVPRPNEGDLIYFPLNKKVFKVMFVEHEAVFYQAGNLPIYEMNCELMEYTGEKFNTGLEFIDSLLDGYNLSIPDSDLVDEGSGLPIVDEDFSGLDSTLSGQNDYYQTEGKKIIDFSELDPFADNSEY